MNEQDLKAEVAEMNEMLDNIVVYVRNLHRRAIQQHLASNSKSAPYFKGQEEALWKVLAFLGHPVESE